jgi:hypothetical protein
MRAPWLAARAGVPTATGGQLVLSNKTEQAAIGWTF